MQSFHIAVKLHIDDLDYPGLLSQINLDHENAKHFYPESKNRHREFSGIVLYFHDTLGLSFNQFQSDALQLILRSGNKPNTSSKQQIQYLQTENGLNVHFSTVSASLMNIFQIESSKADPNSSADKVQQASLQFFFISRGSNQISKWVLYILRTMLLMKMGSKYLSQTLTSLINLNPDPLTSTAQATMTGLNHAMRCCFTPVYDLLDSDLLQLSTSLDLQASFISCTTPSDLVVYLNFLTELLNRFHQIKAIGASELQEVDSLEHVALFYQHQLVCCSQSWLLNINPMDRTMLHLLCSSASSTEPSESPVYLTNTSVVTEEGNPLSHSLGQYAYNLITMPLVHGLTLGVLCNDAL